MNNFIARLSTRAGNQLVEWGTHLPLPFPGVIQVGDKTVTHLKPLGGFRQPGLTKAGRLSFAGLCDGRKVKVYSAYSPQQVALRHAVQTLDFGSCLFPKIIASDANLIVEEWVEGVAGVALRGRDLLSAQAAVSDFFYANRQSNHMIALAKQHLGSFSYLQDYLLKRVSLWSYWSLVGEFVNEWRCDFAAFASKIPICLSHPDISLNNMVYDQGAGKIYFIDNELLGVGEGWCLDWRNSFLHDSNPVPGYYDELPQAFLNKTWKLRQLGSALDAGDFNRVSALFK